MKTRSMIILLASLMLMLSACSSEMDSTKDLVKEVVAKPETSEESRECVPENDDVVTDDLENAPANKAGSRTSSNGSGITKSEQPKKADTKTTSKSESAANQVTSNPKTPKHTHTWAPVYTDRKVQKIRQVPWTKCYACGADMTGNISHIDAHLENHESNVHYGTEYRDEAYYETESYISGYRCSCGATK